ncbi:superoxide dismutase [Aureispira anguillae]|uniref:Superoxide dismutase n=1 Tax=Aureispira anguillae TaxID=2864201 RepID=A0A915YCP0_9BACT|nr:superoxide dismutase [Aureispira anguillae]BDS10618.1 superoxide dismutase [Aureispira anguillae]
MKKRDFLKTSAILTMGAMITPLVSCENKPQDQPSTPSKEQAPTQTTLFELPKLTYAFDALEPHIDARTMEIHHGKHHAGYTKKFNKALEGSNWANKPLTEIMAGVQDQDSDLGLRNNGGGYYNHKLFWEVIGPNKGGEPTAELADAITQSFGSFENFSTAFKDAAKNRFGSGWAWLIKTPAGKLAVTDTPNQDNPLMVNLVEQAGTPILGLDVWEHAYYLHYQNKRSDYINAFFSLINWEAVAQKFAAL